MPGESVSAASGMPGPAVSVVLPVYNGLPRLERCLASLVGQDLPAEAYEVVVVDDGSTDGSGAVLDAFAGIHANVRVIHQENSGWPGRPRNVGTDAARGEYVLYVDADDRLATDALRQLLAFAREHGSDIVVPGTVKVDGDRIVTVRNCSGIKPTVGLSGAFRSLTCHKLFRRDLLVEHDIRFPEGKVTYEDGIFLARAVPRARRISTLGDRAYYVKDASAGRGGISRQRQPFMYERTASVIEILDTLRALTDDDGAVDRLAVRLHHLLLRSWRPRRFLDLPREEQDRVATARQQLIRDHVPDGADRGLDLRELRRSLAFASGKGSVVRALARYERAARPLARLRLPRVLPVLLRATWIRLAAHREAPSRRSRRAPGPQPEIPPTTGASAVDTTRAPRAQPVDDAVD